MSFSPSFLPGTIFQSKINEEVQTDFHPGAEMDINSAFQWGCRTWGRKKAKAWARELRRAMINRLTSTPLACSLAPESEELGIPIRHLIVGRYRILFLIESKTVTVLHIKGSYMGVQ
jgi:plasmid stabilization system protein ParE